MQRFVSRYFFYKLDKFLINVFYIFNFELKIRLNLAKNDQNFQMKFSNTGRPIHT